MISFFFVYLPFPFNIRSFDLVAPPCEIMAGSPGPESLALHFLSAAKSLPASRPTLCLLVLALGSCLLPSGWLSAFLTRGLTVT